VLYIILKCGCIFTVSPAMTGTVCPLIICPVAVWKAVPVGAVIEMSAADAHDISNAACARSNPVWYILQLYRTKVYKEIQFIKSMCFQYCIYISVSPSSWQKLNLNGCGFQVFPSVPHKGQPKIHPQTSRKTLARDSFGGAKESLACDSLAPFIAPFVCFGDDDEDDAPAMFDMGI
jgi:hypothetical protein